MSLGDHSRNIITFSAYLSLPRYAPKLASSLGNNKELDTCTSSANNYIGGDGCGHLYDRAENLWKIGKRGWRCSWSHTLH